MSSIEEEIEKINYPAGVNCVIIRALSSDKEKPREERSTTRVESVKNVVMINASLRLTSIILIQVKKIQVGPV